VRQSVGEKQRGAQTVPPHRVRRIPPGPYLRGRERVKVRIRGRLGERSQGSADVRTTGAEA
jgi:hypothetical protein